MSREHSSYPVAVYLFLSRGPEILLLRRKNTGYQDGNHGLVAGHIESGESVTAAAVREAREEVGIEIAESDLRIVGVMHRRDETEQLTEYIDFFVFCDKWAGDIQNCEPHKCDALTWVTWDHLPDNTIPYIAEAVSLGSETMWFKQRGWD